MSITDPEINKWSFYIRFKISEPLGIDQNSIKLLDDFYIESDSELPLKSSKILKLKNSKPLIYRDICEVSKKVEQALLLAFNEIGIGIAYAENLYSLKIIDKLNNDVMNSLIKAHTTYNNDYYERPLIHLANKFGVVLFDSESLEWDSNVSQENEPRKAQDIEDVFSKCFHQVNQIDLFDEKFKKIEIATNILSTSLFDDSLINRIILSMTSIEVLSNKISRPETEIKVIDRLIEKLHAMPDVNNQIKESLTKSIVSIKNQSISKSCKLLIKQLLGKKEAEKFYQLYEFRSQIVHAGVLKDNKEMYKIYIDSYVLAKKVLEAYIIRNN